jgi:ER lumen protein retaining receptor
MFGIIQTALYIDFGWVYWTRQRVKLRHGGVVDSDDLSRGWLVGRILGRKSVDFDEEEAPATNNRRENGSAGRGGRWGARGISVSADDTLNESRRDRTQNPETEPLTDPNAFEDDEDDLDDPPATAGSKDPHASGVTSGEEWRDDRAK